ncbi:MAG: sel1 repeat family protein, partial [Deltaproteobacteria bacterium]|nr:sel1 repeat family protein [Deltaproteobacteria bacterium]
MKRARGATLRSTWLMLVASIALGCSDVDILRWQARVGDADAQRMLAERYDRGDGVEPDAAEAERWYRTAADSGDALSQLALARMLAEGSAAEVARSRLWLGRAAENGLAEAQFELAVSLAETGEHGKAFEWFLSAASRDHATAQYRAAQAYAAGEGVDRNPAKALEWLERSVEGDCADAQFDLGRRFENAEG